MKTISNSPARAVQTAEELLLGSELLNLSASSAVLNLCFWTEKVDSTHSATVWISSTSRVAIQKSCEGGIFGQLNGNDVFAERAETLRHAYLLFGSRVSGVKISDSNDLVVEMDQACIVFSGLPTSYDSPWDILTDSSDPSIEHDFWIGLASDGEIFIRERSG